MRRIALCYVITLLALLGVDRLAWAQGEPQENATWAEKAQPLWRCLSGKEPEFQIHAVIDLTTGDSTQQVEADLRRMGPHAFQLEVEHPEYAVTVTRQEEETRFALPRHDVVYVGTGPADPSDSLDPQGLSSRLLSPYSLASQYASLILDSDPALLAPLLERLLKMESIPEKGEWRIGKECVLRPAQGSAPWELTTPHGQVSMTVHIGPPEKSAGSSPAGVDPTGAREVKLPRSELERQLVRGIRRASEILAPGPALTTPSEVSRSVEHGELRWQDHQRVVTLRGTPQQIGTAHGQLLRDEAQRCLDSVIYTFGTVETIRSGRWFRHDLERAYERLSPHVPAAHLAELHALADALGFDRHLMEVLSIFPERFHCSGFAVFNSATADGKLYHGRVLDYMTMIGLQDTATTFIVSVDGKIPFANVGYAGFVGSVSGMNAEAISLGEMGGRGEGNWDGVPMATLMRRALEECSTLDDVMNLWRDSPRTCEYYYVFADGKSNRAVGVAATPESVEFIQPGQTHDRLGPGIPDAVVLSAGSRLEKLRERVLERHGAIDVEGGKWLMSRPVAMKSNLHNVLFVPADGVMYVANATRRRPAADTPYVRIRLREYLQAAEPEPSTASLPFGLQKNYVAADSLCLKEDPCQDARQCLQQLAWTPTTFPVQCELPAPGRADLLVRFPSPVASGDPVNDRVAMEWLVARDADRRPIVAPAVIVVHESGRDMTVGKLFARGLNALGLHTFLIHLPRYGERRGTGDSRELSNILTLMRQGIADVRRARDAVVSLPLIAKDHIALQGTSLGGFVSATAGGLDGGFDSVFVMLAGGNLHSVIEQGAKDVADLRKKLRDAGIDRKILRELTRAIEPNRLAHRLPKQRTWLYSGRFDDVVPPASSLSLVNAAHLDSAHHIQLAADHYSGILLLPSIMQQVQKEIVDMWESQPPELEGIPSETRQVVLVRPISPGSTHVRVAAWRRQDKNWVRAIPALCGMIGRNGLAPRDEKREGDGRTPAGDFPMGLAFGDQPQLATGLEYQPMSDEDRWVDDPASPQYNQLVRGETSAASSESMRRADGQYAAGAVIGYNTNPVMPGRGSAIFLHCWKEPGAATSGCVAVAHDELLPLLAWLKKDQQPRIVISE